MKLKKNYKTRCPNCKTLNVTDNEGKIIEGCRCGQALDALRESDKEKE